MNADQWEIVEPGVLVLPTTQYEVRRTERGDYQAYHNGKKIGIAWSILYLAQSDAHRHMRDLIAVGVEP
jgi:hypothetical protein